MIVRGILDGLAVGGEVGQQGLALVDPHLVHGGEGLLQNRLDSRPIFVRLEVGAGCSSTEPGSCSSTSRPTLSFQPLRRKARRAGPIALDDRGVDAVAIGRKLAVDAEIDLHGAAAHRLADDGLDVGLEAGIAVRRAIAELEVPVVDRPHFDVDRQARRETAASPKPVMLASKVADSWCGLLRSSDAGPRRRRRRRRRQCWRRCCSCVGGAGGVPLVDFRRTLLGLVAGGLSPGPAGSDCVAVDTGKAVAPSRSPRWLAQRTPPRRRRSRCRR